MRSKVSLQNLKLIDVIVMLHQENVGFSVEPCSAKSAGTAARQHSGLYTERPQTAFGHTDEVLRSPFPN
jgi:hypothetical protein